MGGRLATPTTLPLDRPGTRSPGPGAVPEGPGPARPGRELVVRRDHWAIRQGEPGGWYLVLHGALREERLHPDGRRTVIDVVGPGDVVGGPPEGRQASGAFALSDALLTRLERDRIELVLGLEARLARLRSLSEELMWVDVPARVERRLLDLARRLGRPHPHGLLLEHRLTQEDLAGLCGTTRESVNRALRALAAAGRVRRVPRGYVVHLGVEDRHGAPGAPDGPMGIRAPASPAGPPGCTDDRAGSAPGPDGRTARRPGARPRRTGRRPRSPSAPPGPRPPA